MTCTLLSSTNCTITGAARRRIRLISDIETRYVWQCERSHSMMLSCSQRPWNVQLSHGSKQHAGWQGPGLASNSSKLFCDDRASDALRQQAERMESGEIVLPPSLAQRLSFRRCCSAHSLGVGAAAQL